MTAVALPRNTSFSTELPGLQLAWDSTSSGALWTCPRYYQYAIVEGYQPRTLSVHLKFGLLVHGAIERYEHARAKGQDFKTAQHAAVRYAMEETWDRERGRPWVSDLPEKTRFTLVRLVVWYLEQFREDTTKTVILANGKPAVELSFRYDSGYRAITGETYLRCGHFDRLCEWNDRPWIMDHKSTKSALDEKFFAQFSPHNQFTNYIFAAKVVYHVDVKGLLVNGCQVGATFSRFQRQPIVRDDAQLEEWHKDFGVLMQNAERYAEAGYWPQNPTACGNYGGCQFREICAKSPKVRQQWLERSFKRRVWDPLIARGDI